jgi:hypothetical protein
MRSSCAVLLTVLALGSHAGVAASAMSEATYDDAVRTWHAEWNTRKIPITADHEACRHYWRTGDPVRSRIKETAPPASRVPFHEALVAFVDSALAAADECLAQSQMTREWITKTREAITLRRALAQVARKTAPGLPANWT